MSNWQTVHMAARVSPFLCPTDGRKMAVRIGPDDEPMLQCYYCNTKVYPGQEWYANIKKAAEDGN